MKFRLGPVRTTLFSLLAILLATTAIAACGGNGGENGPVTLTLYSSGDVNIQNMWKNTLFPAYQKANPNVKLNLVFAEHGSTDQATLARITAAVGQKKDPGMDLIDSGIIDQAVQADLLEPLSDKNVPSIGKVEPALIQQVKSMATPYRGSSVVLAYNTEFVKDPPTTLKGVLEWIKANPEKFTYNTPDSGGSGQAFVRAVLNNHLSQDEQNTYISGPYDGTKEDGWKAGMEEMRSLNPYIYRKGFYPKGNVAVLQLLANKSIWMAPVWSDMALSYLAQNLLPSTVKLVQLDPPFSGGPARIGVPKGAQHSQEAFKFIEWLLQPEQQVMIINAVNGYPGIKWSYLPQETQQKFAAIAHSYATGYLSKYNADVNKQWQSTVAGGASSS